MGSEVMRPMLLLPEILMFCGGLVTLISGSFLARRSQWITRGLAALALLGAAVAAVVGLVGTDQLAMQGAFSIDVTTGVARLIAALGTLMVLALASDEIGGSPRESETYALLLLATTGTLVLAGANDLLVVVVGFLLTTISLYGLIGIARTPSGTEAVMKTYLLGALFGIVLLTGVTILYGVSATTSYSELTETLRSAPPGAVAGGVMGVLAGLMFKAGGVPGHFWIPDAAQGSGGAVAAFLTTVPKIGAIIAAYRLIELLPHTLAWPLLIAMLATASMTLGNLAAYWQSDPRRLLGWSTVSQVGYLLVPVAVAGRSDLALPSLLIYLTGYTVTNLAAFAVTTALPGRRKLAGFQAMSSARPWLAGALVVALLGLVGTPPTAVFVGKLTTATAAWDGGLSWLAVVVFINTLASLFYYLRWIASSYRQPAAGEKPSLDEFVLKPWSAATAVLAAVLSLALGIGAGVLWAALPT